MCDIAREQDYTKLHNSAYCFNPKPCVNDGGEFQLASGGGFVNARRTDQNVLFVPAMPDTTVVTHFRKFMGSDGVERLWLSRNTTGTPVGGYVWDGVGEKVQITSEIFSS
jgi:hypothetical protein